MQDVGGAGLREEISFDEADVGFWHFKGACHDVKNTMAIA